MQFKGQILKMSSELGTPITYYLNLSQNLICMNQVFGKTMHLKHIGYQCVSCNSDEVIFRMGFCKKCFFESPYASDTIIRPELSKAHLGIQERDLTIEQSIQLQPHIVYLAFTGDVKVGVTRASQVPTRWIDQGATAALPIAKTNNRYEAGMIEVALKNHLADKTNWRKMLMNTDLNPDLKEIQNQYQFAIPEAFLEFYTEDESQVELHYPYQTPEKINSVSLQKNPTFSGKLMGIKGQYLAFEGGDVLNVRAHEGSVISLEIS